MNILPLLAIIHVFLFTAFGNPVAANFESHPVKRALEITNPTDPFKDRSEYVFKDPKAGEKDLGLITENALTAAKNMYNKMKAKFSSFEFA